MFPRQYKHELVTNYDNFLANVAILKMTGNNTKSMNNDLQVNIQ